MKRQIALDCVLLCLLTAVLIWPLFQIEYLDDWMSIEGSFIGDARYIAEHFPHPKWHSLWYGGNRFDYIYPPLTRFGAAIASLLFGVIPAQGYHIYIALFYCVGVAAVYCLVRVWTGRRWHAFGAAIAYALVSPVFAFFPAYQTDSLHMQPLRLNVLVKWGEGPHMSALAVLPFALAFLYPALKHRSLPALGACAAVCAIVVSNNLYGAMALARLFPIAVWAIWLSNRDRQIWLRSAAIVAVAYGLCAWWLTPSFVSITARNLFLVAYPGNLLSKVVFCVAVAAFLAVSWKFAKSEWTVFVGGALFFFSLEVIGNKAFDFRIGGEPMRFLPELDLAIILALVGLIRRRAPAYIGVSLMGLFAIPYVSHAWVVHPIDPHFENRIEYRMSEWVAQNLPGSRTFSTGSISLWYTTWRDLSSIVGGSDQGMQSILPSLVRWQLIEGDNAERDIAWMVATGCDAIIVSEAGSQEIYHAMKKPRKFMGKLPVIYDRDGDTVYRVPRRFPGLARVVDEARSAGLPPIPWNDETRAPLEAYAAAAEQSPVQVGYTRESPTAMRLRVRTQPGESILVQETWDEGWRAYDGNRQLEIRKDILNFMRIQTQAGDHDVRLLYDWPTEVRIGQGLTMLSILILVGCAFVRL